MPRGPVDTFSNQKLEALPGYPAAVEALRFMPNLLITRGSRLGQISAASANEVQKIDFTGTWAAGDKLTLSIVGVDGGTYSTTLTMDATPAFTNANVKIAIEGMLEAAGYHGATVAISGGPGDTDQNVTFGGTAAYWNMPLMVAAYETAGNGTVVVTRTTAGNSIGLWGPYVGDKLPNPETAPTAASQTGGSSLPLLGQFIVTYTFCTALGETLPSPGTAVALTTTDRTIRVSSLASVLPAEATGVNYYLNGIYAATNSDGAQIDIAAIADTAEKRLPVVNTAYICTDGRHLARAIAVYDFRTDYMGRVVFAGAGQSPQHGVYEVTAEAYTKGAFKTTDLPNLTTQEAADLGRLIRGSVSDGVLVI